MVYSPLDAVKIVIPPDSEDGKGDIIVDEELLEKHLDWVPPAPKIMAKWSPTPVKSYADATKAHVDIEATSLEPALGRVFMIGIKWEIKDNPLASLDPDNVSDQRIIAFIKSEMFRYRCDIWGEFQHMLERGLIFTASKIDDDKAEKNIILKCVKYLRYLNPDIVPTHNGFDYDWMYLASRAKKLGMKENIYRSIRTAKITSASRFGKPIEFTPTYLFLKPNAKGYFDNKGQYPQIVDTLFLAAQVDKIAANMEGYGLKYLASYIGFRPPNDPNRLVIPGDEIADYWLSGDPEKHALLEQYLRDDLEDQKAVSDFFIPTVWFQRMFFPTIPMQELANASPPRKWNELCAVYYNKGRWDQPESDIAHDYKGALTDCIPGLYKSMFKIDISSLYPSTIIRYFLIDRIKDPHSVIISALKTFLQMRLVFKNIKNGKEHLVPKMDIYKEHPEIFSWLDLANINKETLKLIKIIDGSLKVGINGLYGFLGVAFYGYNSPVNAAIVTAKGRIFMRRMRPVCEHYANLVNLDTDGLCLQPKRIEEVEYEPAVDGHPLENPDNPGFINPEFVLRKVQAVLPSGIQIDLEDNFVNGAIYAPLKKNYIFWKDAKAPAKLKGYFRKRNQIKMIKKIPEGYLRRYAFEGQVKADKYLAMAYRLVEKASEDGLGISSAGINNLMIARSVGKADKALMAANMGERGDQVKYYWGSLQEYTPKKGLPKKRRTRFPIMCVKAEDGTLRTQIQELPEGIKPSDLNAGVFVDWYHQKIDDTMGKIHKTLKEQRERENATRECD